MREAKTYTGGAAAAAVRVYTYACMQARPISTNPGSMEEECEYGLTSATCFTARRLEMVAVAGLLWIYFVVCFFSVWWDFVFFRLLYFERTRPAASMRPPCLMYLSTSIIDRASEKMTMDSSVSATRSIVAYFASNSAITSPRRTSALAALLQRS